MKKFCNRMSGASLVVMASAFASPAWAAEPQDQGASSEMRTDAQESGFEYSNEIIVTATRRELRLQDVPVAVTALSSDSLEQLNVRNTQDLMTVVPGLQVSTQTAGDGGGSATFFLRGMGQQRAGNGSEPAVGIYVDDFYYPSLNGTLFKVVDLERVEVLRGPQGTLYGRNTIGGAIRYTTRGAKLGTFEGNVSGAVGNYDRYEISGAVNIPVGDFAALRLTAGHLEQDGYIKVQTGGPDAGRTKTDLVRVQARIEPTDALYVDVSGQWSKDKIDGFTYTQPGPINPPVGTLPWAYNTFTVPATGAPAYTNALVSQCFYCQPGTESPEFSYNTYKNLLVTIGWEVAEGITLKSLTGWQDIRNKQSFDLDGTVALIYGGGIVERQTYAFSQEVQLNASLFDDRINMVAGGFYYNQRSPVRFEIKPFTVNGAPSPAIRPVEGRNVKSYAGFVDATFKLTDDLSLLGGYRYSEDHKDVRGVSGITNLVVASAAGSFSSSTFRGGLQYQWTPDIMTYASVSTGFRGGGFNPYDPNLGIVAFSPEKSTSYEAGARMQFLNRRITINPTVYYVDWTNIQVQKIVIYNLQTGQGAPVLQNAGKARSYGFELEWAAQVSDAFRLFGNLAYLNIKYTDLGGATGITLKSKLQRAPEVVFSLGGAYTIDLGNSGKVVTTLNYAFQDDQNSTPTDVDTLALPGYGLLNGRIDFTPQSKRFSIGAFMTNIFNKHYYVGGVNYTPTVGTYHYDIGRPREFGLTARVNF